LPVDLRPTTRECVHLVVTSSHGDKDGGHTYHSIAHSRKPHAIRTLRGSVLYRTGVTADRSFTLRE